MPRVAAGKLRSEDTQMRLLVTDSFGTPLRSTRNGNSPNGNILVGEGKETNRDSLSNVNEKGPVQTEPLGKPEGDVVLRVQLHPNQQSQSGLKRPARDGESPVGANWKDLSWNPRVPYPGFGVGIRRSPTSKTKYVSRPIAY
jgi:hypothetical protein